MQKKLTLKKYERIKDKRTFILLAKNGNKILSYPLLIKWIEVDENYKNKVKVAFIVSKRKLKQATKRNKIKRRLKEAYRHLKHSFIPELNTNKSIAILLIYLTDKPLDYKTLYSALHFGLIKILETLKHKDNIK